MVLGLGGGGGGGGKFLTGPPRALGPPVDYFYGTRKCIVPTGKIPESPGSCIELKELWLYQNKPGERTVPWVK
jgi:hypothetical protein